jgi:hypothetical protein
LASSAVPKLWAIADWTVNINNDVANASAAEGQPFYIIADGVPAFEGRANSSNQPHR